MAHNLTSQITFADIKLKSTTYTCLGDQNRTETDTPKSKTLLCFTSFSKGTSYCWFLMIPSRKIHFPLNLYTFLFICYALFVLSSYCYVTLNSPSLQSIHFGDFLMLMCTNLLISFKQLCSIPSNVVQRVSTEGCFGCFQFCFIFFF